MGTFDNAPVRFVMTRRNAFGLGAALVTVSAATAATAFHRRDLRHGSATDIGSSASRQQSQTAARTVHPEGEN